MIQIALSGALLTPLIVVMMLAIRALWQKPINEQMASTATQSAFLIYFACALMASLCVLLSGGDPFKWDLGSFYQTGHDRLTASLYLDTAGSIFLITVAIISNTIVFFSRRYLHRDPGYRRFFMVLSLFVFGITLVACAGTFDLIFVGWEIVGLSSFLLIGFYWHRPSAALNANRAYFIYRITDVGLLASALISHLVWDSPDLFFELSSGNLLSFWEHTPLWQQWTLSLLILLPVIGKSAQFPLCYWLPKAMEGPTPSSAIFYGSLSIHAGVFLLIRTYSIWFHTPGFVWLLGALGLLTSIFATLCGRLQANMKGQVGYASIAQVGLMLVELACGLPKLALAHMLGNAFLRCFQLLVSSSILTQQLQIHSALEGNTLRNRAPLPWPDRLRNSLYVWALNEGYIEPFIRRYIVLPLMRLAQFSNRLLDTVQRLVMPAKAGIQRLAAHWIPAFAGMTIAHLFFDLPHALLAFTLFFGLAAFGETQKAMRTLQLAVLSNATAVFALWLHHPRYRDAALFYLVGLSVSWLISTDGLSRILKLRPVQSLLDFSGLFGQFPIAGALTLVGILGIIGLPICSTFFAEDLLVQYTLQNGWEFLAVFTLTFVLNGIALVRMYSHVFWGRRGDDIQNLGDFSPTQALSRVVIFAAGNCLAFAL